MRAPVSSSVRSMQAEGDGGQAEPLPTARFVSLGVQRRRTLCAQALVCLPRADKESDTRIELALDMGCVAALSDLVGIDGSRDRVNRSGTSIAARLGDLCGGMCCLLGLPSWSVLQRLSEVFRLDGLAASEIGDGA